MATGHLSVDLGAIAQNWAALNALSCPQTETAAVVKADGYGLGAEPVAKALHSAGARVFFVAAAEEGAAVRRAAPSADIYVFSGYQKGDQNLFHSDGLIPMLNAPDQLTRWKADFGLQRFGLQLDSGMNRLGFEPQEFAALEDARKEAALLISHLACADEPAHPMNAQQLATFREMTDGLTVPRSLAATGGVLLGSDYHFDMTRPGIGLFGGAPFSKARAVVTLSVPVIQTRTVLEGESVGYGNAWIAKRDSKIATISAGYADGLLRALGAGTLNAFADGKLCPIVGRISMDLITVDVTELPEIPASLVLLNEDQSVDDLADVAGTIGYEVLTSLGSRYARNYLT